MQTQGYAATGLTQILQESGAPKGSFYFYFPDGKEQLAVEALRLAGAQVTSAVTTLGTSTSTSSQFIRAFVTGQADMLTSSDYRLGCPIATVALEMSSESEPIRRACEEIFASWVDALSAVFAAEHGRRARALAEFALMALEGGLLLSSVRRDPAPLHRVRSELAERLRPTV